MSHDQSKVSKTKHAWNLSRRVVLFRYTQYAIQHNTKKTYNAKKPELCSTISYLIGSCFSLKTRSRHRRRLRTNIYSPSTSDKVHSQRTSLPWLRPTTRSISVGQPGLASRPASVTCTACRRHMPVQTPEVR